MSSTQEVGDIFGQGKGSAQAMLRSPTVLILCVGLWGMNIFFYRLFGIDYKYVLNYDLLEIDEEENTKARRRRDGYAETATSENDLEMMSGKERTTRQAVKSPRTNSRSLSPARLSKAKLTSHDGNSTIKHMTMSHTPTSPLSSVTSQPTMELVQEGSSISWHKLVLFSVVLLFLLHSTTHYWMDHLHRDSIGAVFFFYVMMMLYIFLPVRQNAWLRRAFVIVAKRTLALVHPRCFCIRLIGTKLIPRRIPFVDVFYADAMCSLSKVFFDWGMLAHQAAHYPHPVPQATHNIVIPSICAAFPYLIRARQCLVMYRVGKLMRDPKRYQHLMNAFKYSTSMYPLILSAHLKTFSSEEDTSGLERLLVGLLIVNASYSLYWDIVMDWGMMQDPYKAAQSTCRAGVPSTVMQGDEHIDDTAKGHNKAISGASAGTCYQLWLRPRLRYGLTMTVLIVIADSFLRFSWTLKFVPTLFPSNDSFVLCTQFLEVFRRAIWNLLRVEWENIKQTKKNTSLSKARDSLSDVDPFEHSQNGLPTASNRQATSEKEAKPETSLEMKVLR